MTDVPPDRLSVDPSSPFYDEAALARGVGVRFRGVERRDVEEYCVSEKLDPGGGGQGARPPRRAAGDQDDRRGRALFPGAGQRTSGSPKFRIRRRPFPSPSRGRGPDEGAAPPRSTYKPSPQLFPHAEERPSFDRPWERKAAISAPRNVGWQALAGAFDPARRNVWPPASMRPSRRGGPGRALRPFTPKPSAL